MSNTTCPRCGTDLPDEGVHALSRVEQGIYICSPCGTDEAMRDFTGVPPIPRQVWADQQETT